MADYRNTSDKELLGIMQTDGKAAAELISRYMSVVFSSARRFSGSADYEELVSDGMQALLAAVKDFDETKCGEGGFGAFCSACVANAMRNTVRRSKKHSGRVSSGEDELSMVRDPKPTPEELVIERESEQSFSEEVNGHLTELESKCLISVAEGYSYEETAAALGVTKKVVDNAVARARTKLRRIFPK